MIPITYNHDEYLSNCKKMIALNTEQVEGLTEQLKDASPEDKKQLKMELDGWKRWVKIWEDRYAAAVKAHSKRQSK